ncbi:hypothetical protein QRO11_15540 [Paracidovorax citrulli]|uniref:hypothetical protein n=1 Tax=Paracidovorax citrulli TaxID=80869 RepID=UPI0005FADFCD|nr:hypothetical protein [Paracidovorax citrulli]UMT87759.1 hypothetical protein FRC90_06535 [Paracidovorax citrulli]WIY33362.1 hypothetical protein QRO11_15540 [Paracidovorax citrulli]SDL32692.1 hypothetical protein SAMN04489709_13944 [Paracidovorax citrulli]
MADRPILFSAPMVRALLAGTKTQTRRVWKLPRGCQWYAELGGESEGWVIDPGQPWWLHVDEFRCPYGQPGDRLWVREAWRTVAEADALPPRDLNEAHRIWNEADAPHQPGAGKLRPGMFMPRWASRITLEITAVRVERLQDISREDAMAEGIVIQPDGGYGLADTTHYHATDPRQSYFSLWEAINGPGNVEANPWVWAVTFPAVGPGHG